jgi:hypothetical protein
MMATRKFAARTKVSAEKSKMEIERLLSKHGATSFGSGWTGDGATVVFEMKARRLRFELPLPKDKNEHETRRRWRCLVLVIKAKLEAVAGGIVEFETEFLAHIVIPGSGETIGTWVGPQIAEAYDRGTRMPPLLGAGS